MTAEVIPFSDVDLVPGQPVGTVVEKLRELVERAERGEIISLAYAFVDGGKTAGTGWVSGAASSMTLAGAVAMLSYRFNKATDEAQDDE